MKTQTTTQRQSRRSAWRGSGFSPIRRERGAALVVGLFMLIVVTLLSLSAMQSVRLHERIAGNAYAYSEVFSKTEAAVNGVENCVKDRFEENGAARYPIYRVNEDFSGEGFAAERNLNGSAARTVPLPLDQENVTSWADWGYRTYNGGCYSTTQTQDDLWRRIAGVPPWVILEQLPHVVSSETLQAGAKRDTEVFRVTSLGANADPTTADATAVVILQSILWRAN